MNIRNRADMFERADKRMELHRGVDYMTAFCAEVKDAVHHETWETIAPLFLAANQQRFQRTIKNARFYDRIEKILLWLNEFDDQMIDKALVYKKITEAMDAMNDYNIIDKR